MWDLDDMEVCKKYWLIYVFQDIGKYSFSNVLNVDGSTCPDMCTFGTWECLSVDI